MRSILRSPIPITSIRTLLVTTLPVAPFEVPDLFGCVLINSTISLILRKLYVNFFLYLQSNTSFTYKTVIKNNFVCKNFYFFLIGKIVKKKN